MKKDKNIVILMLSWNKKIYGLMILIIWCLIGPYLYSKGAELILFKGEIYIYLDYMIKFLDVILILFLFLFFKEFLEASEMEITYSIDRHSKLRYLIYCFIIYQIILLPIYIMSGILFKEFYSYLGMLVLQQVFLLSIFYMFSYILKNTLISFGISIVYLMIMISVLQSVSSVFTVDSFVIEQGGYYIKYGCIIAMCLLFGIFFEKRFYK